MISLLFAPRQALFRRLGLALGLAVAPGCQDSGRPGAAVMTRVTATAVDLAGRTAGEFTSATLFKPLRGTPPGVDFDLAPLLLAERRPGVASERFGAVIRERGGRLAVDIARPVVYHSVATAFLDGREYRQICYLWFYPRSATQRTDALEVQGVRLTLDRRGFPVIEEVLTDRSGYHLIFVAKSLEKAASETHGAAFDGRRFSIERRVEEQPRVVVARLLGDGPEPMGPFVYLFARTRDVMTLLCRCTPTQARDVAESVDYEVLPFDALAAAGLDEVAWSPAALGEHFALVETDLEVESPGWLEECLRLPQDF